MIEVVVTFGINRAFLHYAGICVHEITESGMFSSFATRVETIAVNCCVAKRSIFLGQFYCNVGDLTIIVACYHFKRSKNLWLRLKIFTSLINRSVYLK